ncbi:phosphoenolpyruvate--protein phosphotransferase [Salinibius halmophilus]
MDAMLKTLKRIVQEVNAAPDLNAAMAKLVLRIQQSMSVQVCSAFLWDKSVERYRLMATEGLNKNDVGTLLLEKNKGIVGLVGRREEPVNLANASDHPSFHYVHSLGEESLKAFMAAPIIHQKKLLGILVVQRTEARAFDEAEEAFLVTMGAQLAGVIAHAQATGGMKAMAGKSADSIENIRFDGVAGAPGVAIGQAVVVGGTELEDVPLYACKDPQREVSKLKAAFERVREDIKQAGKALQDQLQPEEQALFGAYLNMLEDSTLGDEVARRINEGYAASGSLAAVVMEYSSQFDAMDDPYLRERGADIRDMGRRVLSYLESNDDETRELPERAILVGDELTPAILGQISENRIVGIVSRQGSSNSHIAIIARAMGIPTVMGLVDMPVKVMDGKQLVVDGYRGHLYHNLTAEKLSYFEAIVVEEEESAADLERLKDLPCETLDGYNVPLLVNTGLLTDVVRSQDRGADGVGLYRTEVPFMMRERFPTEREQIEIYREQLQAFAPRKVTMRTLDIGGDKSLPYFPIEEQNPFLGWRGIRVTLDHPEIFLIQVRAMLRASEGLDNLRILLPMVSSTTELEEASHLIHRVEHELQSEGYDIKTPEVGVMIEVPAALYQIRDYASRVDFLSVGSNDLTQYLLAVDRNNPRVADLYDTFHPSVLKALKHIVDEAHAYGVSVTICGEFAGDPAGAILLSAMGFDGLSMSASSLLRVKSVLRQIDMTWARPLVDEVLNNDSPLIARSVLDYALKRYGVSVGPNYKDQNHID